MRPGPGKGRSLEPTGVAVLLKSDAGERRGRSTMYEYTVPPRFAGPPPHSHKQTEEAFFVLEGTVRFELDGESVDAQARAYARVPPGVVHRFSNLPDTPARFPRTDCPRRVRDVMGGVGREDGPRAVVAAGGHEPGTSADGEVRHVATAHQLADSEPPTGAWRRVDLPPRSTPQLVVRVVPGRVGGTDLERPCKHGLFRV